MKNGALKAAESGYLINDLELPSFQCEPILNAIKNEILKQNDSISGCMMSGSGRLSTLSIDSILFVSYALHLIKCKLKIHDNTLMYKYTKIRFLYFSLVILLGTSIYALERKTQNSLSNFNPSLVLSKYPEVRHFKCRFLNK